MSKLLLTSGGFTTPKLVAAFHTIAHKPLKELSIALVSCSVHTDEQRSRLKARHEELDRTGFGTIHELDAADTHAADALDRFDALYMRGGNTFFILETIRKTGFDHLLVSFVLRGGLYIGVSAGSILMGPDIAPAAFGSTGDPNDVNLQDTRGLNLVPFAVMPHMTAQLETEIPIFQAQFGHPLIPLTDEQAMLCLDATHVRIG